MADCYRLISAIDNNRTIRKISLSIAIDLQISTTIDNSRLNYRLKKNRQQIPGLFKLEMTLILLQQ